MLKGHYLIIKIFQMITLGFFTIEILRHICEVSQEKILILVIHLSILLGTFICFSWLRWWWILFAVYKIIKWTSCKISIWVKRVINCEWWNLYPLELNEFIQLLPALVCMIEWEGGSSAEVTLTSGSSV